MPGTDSEHAPAEIDVTPEMIEAGVAALQEWQRSAEWDYRAFVARLYRALAKVAPLPTGSEADRRQQPHR